MAGAAALFGHEWSGRSRALEIGAKGLGEDHSRSTSSKAARGPSPLDPHDAQGLPPTIVHEPPQGSSKAVAREMANVYVS